MYLHLPSVNVLPSSICICQRIVENGRDSGDIQSNTAMFDSVYTHTHTQIHICTKVCVHIYVCIYIYIKFPQFLVGYLRENVARYLVVEKNFQTFFSPKAMWRRWGHNHNTLFSGKSQQICATAHKLLSVYLQNPSSLSSHPLLQGTALEIHTVLP